MELIFIRDGIFDIAGNDASFYSCDDINLLISLIYTMFAIIIISHTNVQ